MTTVNRAKLGCGALCVGLLLAGPAVAKQEPGESSYRFPLQVSSLECTDFDQSVDAEICTNLEMRQQLCAKGSNNEQLASVDSDQCDIRSQ